MRTSINTKKRKKAWDIVGERWSQRKKTGQRTGKSLVLDFDVRRNYRGVKRERKGADYKPATSEMAAEGIY